MKPTLPILMMACVAYACSPAITHPEKKCLNLTSLTPIGTVTFQVNPGKYQKYPRHYLIQVFEDDTRKKLIDTVLLRKKTAATRTIPVQSNYCVVIYKDRLLASYSQMGWEHQSPGSVMNNDERRTRYYASTKPGAYFRFSESIVSKDGSGGSGVRAVVN